MKRFQWEQQSGFYSWEQDEGGVDFRWIGRTAAVALESLPGSMVIPVRCSHPDLEQRPVTLRIYEGNSCMRDLHEMTEIVFRDHQWQDVVLDSSKGENDWDYLKFEVDRIWQPAQWGSPDSRKLGVAVGRMWFRPTPGPAGKDLTVLSSQRFQHWSGAQRTVMSEPGISRLLFDIPGPGSILRLRVKGNKSGRAGPYIIVRIDGRIVGKMILEAEEWSTLEFSPDLKTGSHRLSVEFLTPDGNRGGVPRIVQLGALEVYSFSADASGSR